jgi:hypothetical protein
VVKCILRAAFGVPNENGVVKMTGPMARNRPLRSPLRSPGSDPVRRTVQGMPITMSKPSPMPYVDVPNIATVMTGGPGPAGPRGMTRMTRRTDESLG